MAARPARVKHNPKAPNLEILAKGLKSFRTMRGL